jgi:outer membrane protein assembly factor BamD
MRGPKTPATPTPNRELLRQARAYIEAGKFAKARETLTEVGAREVVEPGLDPFVKIAIADAYYYEYGIENIIEAQARYAQFVSFFPTHDLAGYAQFQLGMCSLKQSPDSFLDQTYTHKAIEEFDKVRAVDPNSRFVRAADQMKERCAAKLAKHDYEVGVFYFKRKAWQGAIGRFKKLVENFPQYESNDAAYYYMGVSLLNWGSVDEGKIYLEKVVRDYPESRWASRAKEALTREVRSEPVRPPAPPPEAAPPAAPSPEPAQPPPA